MSLLLNEAWYPPVLVARSIDHLGDELVPDDMQDSITQQ